MPSDFVTVVISTLLATFIDKYKEISLELDLTSRRVDLIGENFDVAIRMGDLTDDASLAARRLAVFSTSLYASPHYLARRGTPSEPEALMEHDALRLLQRNGEPMPWVMIRDDQRWEGIPPGRATANSPELLIRLARAGAGIASVSDHFVEPYVRIGELVPVLADWSLPLVPAWAVFPGRRLMPARTRVFLDALQAEFSGPRCQAEQDRVEATKREIRARTGTAAPRPA
jgi:DNA-binding transcriptional LysR family regulator